MFTVSAEDCVLTDPQDPKTLTAPTDPPRRLYRAKTDLGTLGDFRPRLEAPDATAQAAPDAHPLADRIAIVEDDSSLPAGRYWTAQRVLLLILVLIMIITLLATTFSGLFTFGQPTPPPPPTLPPMPMI
jgi:hypothetical protein